MTHDPHTNRPFLNNYVKLGDSERILLSVAEFSCYPIESCLTELMRDDRFRLRFPELMDYVSNLSSSIFDDVARTVGLPFSGVVLKRKSA